MGDRFQEGDPLWNLLGKGSRPAVRPEFRGRVMANVREERSSAARRLIPFPGRRWALGLPVAAAAAACVAVALLLLDRPDPVEAEPNAAANWDEWESRYVEAIQEAPEPDDALAAFYYVDSLLAEDDVSNLEDEEIVALLY